MFARLLRDFGMVRVAEMAGEGVPFYHLRATLKDNYCPVSHQAYVVVLLCIARLPDSSPDKQDDPDEHVKEAFTEIRQVVTGQGDEKGDTLTHAFHWP